MKLRFGMNDTDLSTIIKNRIMKQDSSTFVKVENVSTGSYEVFISAIFPLQIS